MLVGRNGVEPSGGQPEITPGILNALEASDLILQEIKYQTRTKQLGTARNPRVTETQSERSRKCTLTRKAYEAVDSDFVLPNPQPTSASFHFHGDVNQSIIGTQNRAELTNNFDFGQVEAEIEEKGGEDKEELRAVLEELRELLERGETLDRGALSGFSGVMEQHSWFTGAVTSALLGFATQAVG